MKVAVIGAGAAGMTTAYLLHEAHDVTVLERQAIPGGNIRTLNKNVTTADLDPDLVIDNGVIEFPKDGSPHFNRLMADLDIELAYVPDVSTQMFLADGRVIQALGAIRSGGGNVIQQGAAYMHAMQLAPDYAALRWRTRGAKANAFERQPASALLGQITLHRWLKMLLMYSYSIPFGQIDQIPAELALGMLKNAGIGTQWNRIVGGVYTYIERILARFSGTLRCGVEIAGVTRRTDSVCITLQGGERINVDAVIFATPPDQVLKLLTDPDEAERRRFAEWKANKATTLIHTDMSLYKPYGVPHHTEFDVFEKAGGDAGYNAYLNRLCSVPENGRAYNLAYNMEEHIDPDRIIDRQEHHTPLYTVGAFQHRDEIIATNGDRRTYHAGAYLGNGLHEGAIASASAAAMLFGGKAL